MVSWLTFSKIMLMGSASSILIYKCWVYRNSFERHSYKISLLTDFFKEQSQKPPLASGHLSVWISWFVNAIWLLWRAAVSECCLVLLAKVWRQTVQEKEGNVWGHSSVTSVCAAYVWVLNSTVLPDCTYNAPMPLAHSSNVIGQQQHHRGRSPRNTASWDSVGRELAWQA